MMPVVSIRDLTIKIGAKLVLDNCSLDVHRGLTCIMGQSGTGKSTLLKAVDRLLRPAGGQILFEGRDITQLQRYELFAFRRNVGFVFQEGALFTSLSVYDNVALALRERERPPEVRTQARYR